MGKRDLNSATGSTPEQDGARGSACGDALKQAVLDVIQSGFPLELRPYDALARRFGCAARDVRRAVAALYEDGSVRRIGASFDSRKLGYTSTLCALAVPGGEDELQRAADAVSALPGVTHNYGRDNRYNLWFTLITRSSAEKQRALAHVRQATGCDDLLDMPSTKRFKIAVDFGKQRASAQEDGGQGDDGARSENAREAEPITLEAPFDADDPFDVELVRWTQGDVARDADGALLDDPYEAGAMRIGKALGDGDVSAERLVARLCQLKADRTVRRFGAMVRHQVIGFAHNSMTVWNIPDERADAAGALFADAPFVSHCYTRPRQNSWPFNLYAMTHAQTADELGANVAHLHVALEEAGITCQGHEALTTTREYKKVSMTYFHECVKGTGDSTHA